MSTFIFNRIYVIESLKENFTGKELYDDLLKWQEYKFKELKAIYCPVNSKSELFCKFDEIAQECKKEMCSPVFHFEIHGDNQLRGLVLSSGELISWDEFGEALTKINIIVKNNLFLTMAVCHGAYLMQTMKISSPVPFYGFIGSFDEIKESDLRLRYNEFYTEFFSSFKIHTALEKMHVANPDMPSTYQFICAEIAFKKVYGDYFNENLSDDGIKRRVQQTIIDKKITITNRREKREFERKFTKRAKETKETYYKEHRSIFFMLNIYPEIETRFNIPASLNKLCEELKKSIY